MKKRKKEKEERFKLLITGSAGFAGHTMVPLALEKGFSLRVTDLKEKDFSFINAADVEIFKGDLLDKRFCDELCKGIHYIIHNAALFSLQADRDTLIKINVESTRNITDAAIRNKVRHLIYISTADVYGTHKKLPINEDFDRIPDNDYASSKLLSEEECIRMGKEAGLPVTVLRPTAIYGPYSTYIASVFYTLPFIIHEIMGVVPNFRGGPLLNLVHVEDVAGASIHLLGKEEGYYRSYNVNDDTWMNSGDFIRTMASAFGLRIGRIPVFISKKLLKHLGRFGDKKLKVKDLEKFNRLLQKRWKKMQEKYRFKPVLKPSLHKGFTSYLLGDHVYDNSRLKETGYRLRHPDFFHSFKETALWYIEKRWVPDISNSY